MSSSKRRGSSGLIGILVFLLILGGILVAVFTFTSSTSDGSWPLGIEKQEVAAYRSYFDMSSATVDSTLRVVSIELTAWPNDTMRPLSVDHPQPRWMRAMMTTDGVVDSMRIRRLRSTEGAYLLKAPKNSIQRNEREIVLIPASAHSMKAKYAEVMAQELGLVAPEISFVRLSINDEDQGIFLREARVTQQLLEKKRLSDAVYFEHGFNAYHPEHNAPDVKDSAEAYIVREKIQRLNELVQQHRFDQVQHHLDIHSSLSLLLMLWCEQRLDLLLHEGPYVYDRTTGRIKPMYRSKREAEGTDDPETLGENFLTPLLHDKELYQQFGTLRAKFSGEAWRLKERFAAMDEVWLPVVASCDPAYDLDAVKAIADKQKQELLKRLSEGDPRSWLPAPDLIQAGSKAWNRHPDPLLTYTPSGDPDAELDVFVKKYAAFIMGDTLLFPRGKYIIEEDIFIPPGKTLMFRSGARVFLGPGVNILCYGPLKVRGSLLRPVFIRALDPLRPWGTIAVSGDGNTLCEFQGLYVSDGSEAVVNGLTHTGMISIHNSDARFEQCSVYNSHGEDLINVKNGKVYFRDCNFRQAHMDLIDLDNCTGTMRDCVVLSDTETGNGDGMDVSNTRLLLHGNTFVGNPDKGLSVGEASEVLVVKNRFENNHTAIAIKDLSVAYVSDNIFLTNDLVYHVFCKKPIFGGGRAVLYTNEYYDNKQDRDVDALSTVVQEQQLDEGLKERFGLDERFDVRPRRRRR